MRTSTGPKEDDLPSELCNPMKTVRGIPKNSIFSPFSFFFVGVKIFYRGPKEGDLPSELCNPMKTVRGIPFAFFFVGVNIFPASFLFFVTSDFSKFSSRKK
jgi:hypothetical protein